MINWLTSHEAIIIYVFIENVFRIEKKCILYKTAIIANSFLIYQYENIYFGFIFVLTLYKYIWYNVEIWFEYYSRIFQFFFFFLYLIHVYLYFLKLKNHFVSNRSKGLLYVRIKWTIVHNFRLWALSEF